MYKLGDKVEIMWYTYCVTFYYDNWYFLNNRGGDNRAVFRDLWVDSVKYCWLPENTWWLFPYHKTLEQLNKTIDKLLWEKHINIYDLIW